MRRAYSIPGGRGTWTIATQDRSSRWSLKGSTTTSWGWYRKSQTILDINCVVIWVRWQSCKTHEMRQKEATARDGERYNDQAPKYNVLRSLKVTKIRNGNHEEAYQTGVCNESPKKALSDSDSLQCCGLIFYNFFAELRRILRTRCIIAVLAGHIGWAFIRSSTSHKRIRKVE